MAKFVIPQSDAEAPTSGGGSDLFPEGTWRGKIEIVRIQEAKREPQSGPAFALSEGAIYGEFASIQLGEIEAVVDGQPDVGNRKFFDDLILLSEAYADGSVIQWDQPTGDDDENWRFSQTRKRLTNLALALDAVERSEDGVGPVDNFGDLVREAAEDGKGISGASVIFEIGHRKYKTKKGEPGVAHLLKSYYPAS